MVIGLGSPLMGDDGLGLAALEALCQGFDFEPAPHFVDGGTWGMNLLPAIESADRVLFVDAIRAGGEPGALVVLERDALPRGLGIKLSPHQIDLQEVLALAWLRGTLPEQSVAMGLEPQRVELGCELSPLLATELAGLVDRILLQLSAWGHLARPRSGGATRLEPRAAAENADLGP